MSGMLKHTDKVRERTPFCSVSDKLSCGVDRSGVERRRITVVTSRADSTRNQHYTLTGQQERKTRERGE